MAGVTSVVIDGTTYLVDDINAVDFSEDQGLSEQQQEQGRSNIGAASTAALADKAEESDVDALESALDDLSDDVAELTEQLADKADVIVDTASGAIASFPDGASVNASDLVVGIEPVQDLHGYDHPWPAGGGKNLLQLTVDTIKSLNGGASSWIGNQKTINDVVVTILTDADDNVIGIQASGTANANINILLATKTLLDALGGGSFILSGSPAGGATDGSTYFAGFYAPGKSAYDFGSGTTIQLSGAEDSITNIYLRIANNYHANNIVFKPMIRLSSVSDATFAPYSNICPITGWTGVEVTDSTHNLFGGTYLGLVASGTVDPTKGIISSLTGVKSALIPIKGGMTYAVQKNGGNRFSVCESAKYPEVGDVVDILYNTQDQSANLSTVVTPSSSAKYLLVYVSNAGDEAPVQVEFGSTVTTYAEGTSTTYPISWQTEAGTVYGGTLDVTTGLLTVTMAEVDLGTLNWGYSTTPVNYFGVVVTGKKPGFTNLICSDYPTNDSLTIYLQPDKTIRGNDNASTVVVKDSSYTDATTFKSAMSGVQLVYELATPQTYQLTPTEVEMLLGENNVWADTGDSTVAYRADTKLYIQKINAPTDDDMIADAQIASGRYFIVGGNLYKSTTTIPAGDAINPGSNCILTNLADALNALNT